MAVLAGFIVPHPPIILPEVGRGEERKIKTTADAFREAARRIGALKPDTVVLTSPHAILYADYFHISPGGRAEGDFRDFGAREIAEEADYDAQFVAGLSAEAARQGLPAGTLGERNRRLDHGTLIPLRFLHEFYRDFRLVRVGLSGLPALDHYRLGQCVQRTAENLGRRVVFVASGDLSHKLKAEGPYGFAPQGPEFDRQVTKAMAEGDFLKFLEFEPDFCDGAAECGLRSFQIMAGALDRRAVKSELLSYEGPFGVGYGVAAFEVAGEDGGRNFGEQLEARELTRLEERKTAEDPYVRLARLALETYVRTGRPAELPEGLPDELQNRRAGVFVSLKKDGVLRGCIGTTAPTTRSVAREILRNAVSSGTEDPRFPPVTEKELPRLVYSVDVLGENEPVASRAELDAGRYGVIVSNGHRQGLLLPNLEGVDTVDEQIEIARRKAGIGPGEPCELRRFEVVRHK